MPQPSLEALSQPMNIKILSSTPGRIRLRVSSEQREPEVFAEIANTLQVFFPQSHTIRTNVHTGSITVYYRGELGDFDEIIETLEDFGITVGDVPSKTSQGATAIANTFTYLNQRVEQTTRGLVDLRLLFPLILALFALRRWFVNGSALKTSPWYVFAWYAFDSFLKLNNTKEPPQQTSNGKHPPTG
ncbi:MAG: hypothetical protein QNJ63_29490 [Calothrix sp. MO_192.B10]|nr:hypothetical protein [Calothrix sp. MO_192.B10]